MNSTYKYYSTAFAIFEFHSFDQQTSVADDLQVMHSVSEVWVSLNWSFKIKWSGWRDLNARPLRPERSALPNWATSRHGMDDIKFISNCPLLFKIYCEKDD